MPFDNLDVTRDSKAARWLVNQLSTGVQRIRGFFIFPKKQNMKLSLALNSEQSSRLLNTRLVGYLAKWSTRTE